MERPMTDVAALQSIAERLAKIANDCFDLKAVERLRHLGDEIQMNGCKPRVVIGHSKDKEMKAGNA